MKLNLQALQTDLFSRVGGKDKAVLARQLATMLGAGLAIDQSFRILSSQAQKQTLKKAYLGIVTDLEQGNSLSFSLSKYNKIFDPVFIAIVRSGENSGKLDLVLNQLADRLELTEEFNSKIKAAMYYPAFIVITMVVIIFLMMIFIVPQLKSVFADMNVELPLATRMIIAVSNFTVKFWWLDVIVLIAIVAGFSYFIRTKEGGSTWDKFKIHLPIARELYTMIYMARFCRTMSMLIQAGIPIMETIAISADVIQNHIYTKSLKDVAAQVERGIPMSVPLQKDKNFPPVVSEMIMVGEQTGKIGPVLTKLAEYYERETDTRIKSLSSLVEPVIIVIVGIGVGFLVFSIIWPIYSLAQANLE
ncbi:MAG: putative Type IV pilus assembly protein PilC [Berkelbacteria bacterium GW2011_GWE1_39_12]|uniref:Putative Type IV pilus assembly protein PilC n=1 Tax=Berkelbacteria bacterium GW2011_GWE1_39_12 TaxID=1618337 RepID=A0A0G4B4G6_9BACT|nr:MAG: putative Type IV pilus assembly protein PilC [Berkelbacteria bacterium GW2011_GWE1_39_12]